MPMTLADGRVKVTALLVKPANPLAPTTTELTAVGTVSLEGRVMKSDYRLSAVASDTVDEAPLNATGNAQAPGYSNFEGTVTVFRFLDTDGQADPLNDVAYELLKEKGTELYLVEREGPEADIAFAAGDEVEVWHVITDEPQKPSDRQAGYIKRTVPLLVQRVWPNAVVAAGA